MPKANKTPIKKQDKQPKQEPVPYVVMFPHLLGDTWTVDQINAHADGALQYFKSNRSETMISRYFTINNIPRSSYSTWSAKSDYFKAIWEILKTEQEERLARMVIDKEYSTAGVCFTMKNVTSWRDAPADDGDKDRDDFNLINNWDK